MPVHDDLGTRMKTFYEQVPKFNLYRRTPVAIRLDGRAFHTFTRGFQEPYDEVFSNAMIKTMDYLCRSIQGCVFGYTQSDEITLILIDYQTFETEAFFNYEVQKLCSISASMATMAFNKFFEEEVDMWGRRTFADWDDGGTDWPFGEDLFDICYAYDRSIKRGATFDSRCFNIPKEEVTNLVYWRQLDAMRNSAQMLGQHYYSDKELDGVSCEEIKDKVFNDYGVWWQGLRPRFRHGTCWTKELGIDYDMPILKGADREYLDKLIYVGD